MKIAKTLTILIFSLSLASINGCASKKGTGALFGAGGGAALGAGIGALVGGKKGALIGAGIGAATGAMIGTNVGHYMDKQEAKMRQKLTNAQIVRKGDDLYVKFSSGILFATNSANLKSNASYSLTTFSDVLNEFNHTTIVVEGHTDTRGSASYNKLLSENRANSVRGFLGEKHVSLTRVSAIGYGEAHPIFAEETNPSELQANRRVEIKISPSKKLRKAYEKI